MQPIHMDMERVRSARWWFMALGAVLVVLGTIAIVYPIATSVTISKLVGILLIVGAFTQGVHAIASWQWRGFFMHLAGAVVYLAAGLLLLTYSFGTVLTVTLLLGIYLFVAGVFKIINSFFAKPHGVSGWLLFSGLVDFVLGGLIWAAWPSDSAVVIGLLVGIDLIVSGWTMFILGATSRMMAEEEALVEKAEEKDIMRPKAA